MTQEEKQLLLIDLCARLPFGVMVSVQGNEFDFYKYPYQLTAISKFGLDTFCKVYHPVYTPFGVPKVEDVKPYLRPMSSMTKEEKKVVCSMNAISDTELNERLNHQKMYVQNYTIETFDYFNEHHFDYRGLIPMGLALEAEEGMYKDE